MVVKVLHNLVYPHKIALLNANPFRLKSDGRIDYRNMKLYITDKRKLRARITDML